MNTRLTHTHCFSASIPIFKITPSILHKPTHMPSRRYSLPKFHVFPCILHPPNPNFKVTVTGAIDIDDSFEISGDECGELTIEACLTRTLPPALTLEHGLLSLKEAAQDLKLNPPSCSSGMIRFQVAIPPVGNAWDWFSSQPELSGVFPQFYLSKDSGNPTHKSPVVSKNYGVFGIGAAVDLRHSSSSSGDWNTFRRYLLVDSLNITAYGFIDVNYDFQSSYIKHENGSFYFVIPQIELNEHDGYGILAGTLAWGDFFPRNFEQALHSYQMSLLQAIDHIPATLENCHANSKQSSVQKFNIVEMENLKMVHMEAQELGNCYNIAASAEMVSSSP